MSGLRSGMVRFLQLFTKSGTPDKPVDNRPKLVDPGERLLLMTA
jgi:hypothetical protein